MFRRRTLPVGEGDGRDDVFRPLSLPEDVDERGLSRCLLGVGQRLLQNKARKILRRGIWEDIARAEDMLSARVGAGSKRSSGGPSASCPHERPSDASTISGTDSNANECGLSEAKPIAEVWFDQGDCRVAAARHRYPA